MPKLSAENFRRRIDPSACAENFRANSFRAGIFRRLKFSYLRYGADTNMHITVDLVKNYMSPDQWAR